MSTRQIMAECDCQHDACRTRGYCMAERIEALEARTKITGENLLSALQSAAEEESSFYQPFTSVDEIGLSGALLDGRFDLERAAEILSGMAAGEHSQPAQADIDAAVLAEREACAQVVEQIREERCAICGHTRSNHHYRHMFVATGGTTDAAAAIRARSNTTPDR